MRYFLIMRKTFAVLYLNFIANSYKILNHCVGNHYHHHKK